MPPAHPLYAGSLPLWSPDVRQALAEYDLVLVAGMNLLRLFIHREPANPIPEHIRLIHLDADPWEVGKNYPPEVGLLGDPKAGLAELSRLVSQIQTSAQVRAAAQRREEHTARRVAGREALLASIEAQHDRRPMTPLALMGALARSLPPDAAVVEEATTTHQSVLEKLGLPQDPAGHFAHRGWALGWGLGCAIGVKLAWPDRPVLSLLGDGAALYGIQGLWTAAHHRIPLTFVIANNAQYKILKLSGVVMELPQMTQGETLGMDLVEPEVDFVGLARSFGVQAHRVTGAEELGEHLRASFAQTEPVLLDVPIDR
jgi:benzoylformate decarboxylase